MQHSSETLQSNTRLLLMLAWPAIAEQLLLTMTNYVDTAMIGALNTDATAAVAINSTPVFFIVGLLTAVGVGYSVQIAHSLGARQEQLARSITRQALLGSLVSGTVIMLVTLMLAPWVPKWLGADSIILGDAQKYLFFYALGIPFQTALAVFSAVLRCAGDTKTPLQLNAGANVLNVILNFFLIFPSRTVQIGERTLRIWGAGWGAAGAAGATAFSASLMGFCCILLLFRRSGPVNLELKVSYRPDFAIIRQAVHLGIPAALERGAICSGQLLITRMVASLGNVALAANHVAVTAEAISYLPATGVSFAATTLVGQAYGGGKYSLARQFGKISGWIGLLSGGAAGIILFVCATPLAGIFSPDPDVIELAADMLRIVAVSEPLFGLSIVLSGVLRGAGNTRLPFLVVLSGMWGVRVILTPVLLFYAHMELAGVWVAMVADLMFRGILCEIQTKRLLSSNVIKLGIGRE